MVNIQLLFLNRMYDTNFNLFANNRCVRKQCNGGKKSIFSTILRMNDVWRRHCQTNAVCVQNENNEWMIIMMNNLIDISYQIKLNVSI